MIHWGLSSLSTLVKPGEKGGKGDLRGRKFLPLLHSLREEGERGRRKKRGVNGPHPPSRLRCLKNSLDKPKKKGGEKQRASSETG